MLQTTQYVPPENEDDAYNDNDNEDDTTHSDQRPFRTVWTRWQNNKKRKMKVTKILGEVEILFNYWIYCLVIVLRFFNKSKKWTRKPFSRRPTARSQISSREMGSQREEGIQVNKFEQIRDWRGFPCDLSLTNVIMGRGHREHTPCGQTDMRAVKKHYLPANYVCGRLRKNVCSRQQYSSNILFG